MTDKYPEQLKKVRGARIKLLADHPFFGDLAFGLPIRWDENLNPPTAATDGQQIIFHPEFVKGLPLDETIFLLAHEVMHPALMHILRRGNRCPKRWNVACDIVVNELLIDSGIGKMPEFGIYKPDIYQAGQGKVEKIYDLLPEGEDYGEPGSGGTGSLDSMLDAPPGKQEEMAANWRNKLQQALHTAKQAGKMPGGLEQFVNQMTKPKVSWQDKLRAFVMTTRGDERTWTKSNRRHISSGIMLPGNYGEKMGPLAYLIDCSGSTSDQMVSQSGAEVGSIQEELRPEKIHVLYFDTEVKKHEEFEPDDPLEVKVYGRGGTCFRTSFEYMSQMGIEPECAIVVTDLDCSDYGPDPGYPVLWCVLEGQYNEAYMKPPWGEVLVVD